MLRINLAESIEKMHTISDRFEFRKDFSEYVFQQVNAGFAIIPSINMLYGKYTIKRIDCRAFAGQDNAECYDLPAAEIAIAITDKAIRAIKTPAFVWDIAGDGSTDKARQFTDSIKTRESILLATINRIATNGVFGMNEIAAGFINLVLTANKIPVKSGVTDSVKKLAALVCTNPATNDKVEQMTESWFISEIRMLFHIWFTDIAKPNRAECRIIAAAIMPNAVLNRKTGKYEFKKLPAESTVYGKLATAIAATVTAHIANTTVTAESVQK